MGRASRDQVVTVEGRTIKLSNLDKVLYPQTQTTKADVLSYYA
jgi:bifunctional non-homologous end joining protein LigD